MSEEKILIFLPGNPSIPGVYTNFLTSLKDELDLNVVFDLIHYGQDLSQDISREEITLTEVISQHRSRIKEIISEYPSSEIILMGHSLGAAAAVEIYDEFKNHISCLYLLMPFLYLSGDNKFLIKVLGVKPLNFIIYALFRIFISNKRLRKSIFAKSGKEQANLVEMYLGQKKYLKNFTKLLLSYHSTFKKNDFLKKAVSIDSQKVIFLFAENDFWAPASTSDLLPKEIVNIVIPEIAHDFCLSSKDSNIVISSLKKIGSF